MFSWRHFVTSSVQIKSMKFETVRIHFLSDVFGLFSSRNFSTMATWRNDFSLYIIILQTGHVSWLELEKGRKYKLITRAMRPLLFGKLLSSHCHLIETEAGERYIYEFYSLILHSSKLKSGSAKMFLFAAHCQSSLKNNKALRNWEYLFIKFNAIL